MEPIMQFFAFEHLGQGTEERKLTEAYYWQAIRLLDLPRNPERTVALRKLLESKDAALRAAAWVFQQEEAR